jgi:hypothetical protein
MQMSTHVFVTDDRLALVLLYILVGKLYLFEK